MTSYFGAIAWLRWRTLINTMRSGRRRDKLEEVSRFGAVLVPIAYAVMLIPACLALAGGALIGGWFVARAGGANVVVIIFARVFLALATLGVLMAPLVRSMQGLQLDIGRLMLLPIPRRALHLAEWVGGVADPWVAIVIPGLWLLPVGMVAGGAVAAGLATLLAGLAFLAVLGSLSSLLTFGVMLVFRDRRRAEWLTLLLMLAFAFAGFLPLLIEEGSETRPADSASEHHPEPPDFEAMFRWAAPFPSELYAQAAGASAAGRIGASAIRIGALAAMACLLYLGSSAAHRKLLENPERTGPRRSGGSSRAGRRTIPGAGETVSAIALTQVRTVLRTVRGKMAVYFVAVFLLSAGVIFLPQVRSELAEIVALEVGPLMLLIGVVLTLLSLQPVLLNQFAVDGSGLTMQLLTPATDRELVHGKALGCAMLAGISLLLCWVGSLVVSADGSAATWLATALACGSSIAVVTPACAAVSAVFPKSADLSKLGKAGNPHPVAAFVGIVLTALALVPPVALYAAGVLLGDSHLLGLSLVAAWTVVSIALWVPLVRLAAAAVTRRRENLFLVVSES